LEYGESRIERVKFMGENESNGIHLVKEKMHNSSNSFSEFP
jgi:hypothetical protein